MNGRLLLIFLLIATPFAAQSKKPDASDLSMTIGQATLRLGMSEAQVFQQIRDPMYLEDLSPENGRRDPMMWVLREKHGEQNYVLVGSVTIRNGRLTTISRDLGGFNGKEALDVGRILFEAFERLKTTDSDIAITTRNDFVSSVYGQVKTVTIGKGLHRVEVAVPEPGKGPEMVIREILSTEPILVRKSLY